MSDATDELTAGLVATFKRLEEIVAENKRLRAFHNAWLNSEVSHATGNPGLVKRMRTELIAAHKAVRP